MLYFLDKGFWTDPWLLVLFLGTLPTIIFLQYFTFAYLYQALLRKTKTSTPKMYDLKRRQIRREIKWSFLSSVVFTVFCALCLFAWQKGWTMIYEDIHAYPVWYLFASAMIVIFLYETYYYWLHLAMHIPAIFKVVHRTHHESLHPTVFTSFCFHPLEAMLQFLFFPLLIILMPIHYGVLLSVLMIFTASAVIIHGGVEVFNKRFLLKHLIGSSHHDLHHQEFKTNFGLYFTWWDKWMKTESEKPLCPSAGESSKQIRE